VGVDALARLEAEELRADLLHARHAGHAADQDDVLDLRLLDLGLFERLGADVDRAIDEIRGELLELVARERGLQVERFVAAGRDDERQVDLGLAHARQLALRLLGDVFQALQGHLVLAQIDLVLLLEAEDEPVDDAAIEVLAAEEGVAGGRDDLEHAVADLEDRDVEGAAAEIVDRDLALDVAAEAVRERGGGRLVDDADDVEAGDAARVLGRLALAVVEVRGHRDH